MAIQGVLSKGSVPSKYAAGRLHFYFASDAHDGYPLIDRFISRANAAKPDLVLSGGDMTEEGTAREHALLNDEIGKLSVPFVALPGNHDYRGSELGRYESEFGSGAKSFDAKGVHFVTFDNAEQTISESTFKFLEKDLAANKGKPTVVAGHVPVVWKPTPKWIQWLHKLLPSTIADYRVEDPAQAKRFTDLMSANKVSLVLSGHTHVPGEKVVGGVRYVTVGALGGKLGHLGTNHEYLDIAVKDGKVSVRHVGLDAPLTNAADLVRSNLSYLGRQAMSMVTGRPYGVARQAGPGASVLSQVKRSAQHGLARIAEALNQIPPINRFTNWAYGKLTMPSIDTPIVPNLHRVDAKLLRGGQATAKGFKALKAKGVSTVVNLRPEANWEAPILDRLGLKEVYLPLDPLGAPTNAQATSFLKAVTDPANGKVFVHCQHGADRTGAMVAAYRIAKQGWTADQAITEMKAAGFHQGWEDDKLSFVHGFETFWKGLSKDAQGAILHDVHI